MVFGKILNGFFICWEHLRFFTSNNYQQPVVEGIWIGGTMALLLYLFITSTIAAIVSKKI